MDRPRRTPRLSVVFPAYNDAGTIASMVLLARRIARERAETFELIVVDDGSRDGTPEVLAELARLVPELRVVRHAANRGYGAAVRSGLAAARGDLVFYTDGDAQFDPRELAALLDAWDEHVDCVNGVRARRADPWPRVVLGRPYHWLVRKAFGLPVRDPDCDFRLFRRSVLDGLALEETDGAFTVELLKKLGDRGARFREVPVHHYPRVYGRSQYYTPRGVFRAYRRLLGLWWRLVVRKDRRRVPLGRCEPGPLS